MTSADLAPERPGLRVGALPRARGVEFVVVEAPTTDEIQRVREYECTWHGHRFSEVVELSDLAPKRVICMNCGKSWAVEPDAPSVTQEVPDEQ